MAQSRPELKFSEAPLGGLRRFSEQFLEEVGDGEYGEARGQGDVGGMRSGGR